MRWGNFIGCKVSTKRGKGILKEITYNQVGIKIDGLVNTPQCEYFYFDDTDKDCKPILRPLSSMTDEEKREFDIIEGKKNKKLTKATFDGEHIIMRFSTGGRVGRTSDLIYLMEKGFYVNQCREDECILEG
jgi:hypothetical protein